MRGFGQESFQLVGEPRITHHPWQLLEISVAALAEGPAVGAISMIGALELDEDGIGQLPPRGQVRQIPQVAKPGVGAIERGMEDTTSSAAISLAVRVTMRMPW